MEEVPRQLNSLKVDKHDVPATLERLGKLTGFFKSILTLAKQKAFSKQKAVLTCFLKHGRLAVEHFTKKWMPLLEEWLSDHQEDIMREVMKSFQQGTRQLHTICSHGKAAQELGIAALVPKTKKTLETLMFRVKVMTEKLDGEAFSVGNLSTETGTSSRRSPTRCRRRRRKPTTRPTTPELREG